MQFKGPGKGWAHISTMFSSAPGKQIQIGTGSITMWVEIGTCIICGNLQWMKDRIPTISVRMSTFGQEFEMVIKNWKLHQSNG